MPLVFFQLFAQHCLHTLNAVLWKSRPVLTILCLKIDQILGILDSRIIFKGDQGLQARKSTEV